MDVEHVATTTQRVNRDEIHAPALQCYRVSRHSFYFCASRTKSEKSGGPTRGRSSACQKAAQRDVPYLLCRCRVAINSREFTALGNRHGTTRILFTARGCYLVSFRRDAVSYRGEETTLPIREWRNRRKTPIMRAVARNIAR